MDDGSPSLEICFHCAPAAVAKKISGSANRLSFRTVLVDQSLKALIFADRIPLQLQLEQMRCDCARALKQTIENFDRAVRVAAKRIDFGELLRNLRTFERIHTFGQ